jgi:acetyl esterase/lipase
VSWALTAIALAVAGFMIVVAVYMVRPVNFDGLGKSGLVALLFPLHLLVVTVIASGVSALAWGRSTAAVVLAGAAAVLSAVMALWPCLVTWGLARRADVRLSLRSYLANALRPNLGGPQPSRTVVYATTTDGTELALDVWSADLSGDGARRPAVIKVHGGSWIGGQRSEQDRWNRWLNDLGFHVFDIEYRLAPGPDWTDEVGDVKAALGWVAVHADEYHIDPARISLMGISAGGNLALLAAYTVGDPGLPPSTAAAPVMARCVVNLYGPADLTLLHGSTGSLEYVQRALGLYLLGTPTEQPDRYRTASPVSHAHPAAPPTLTVTGGRDRIIPPEQADVLDRALAAAGVARETLVLPADDHGFDVNWGGFGTQVARAHVERFLRRHG